MGSFQMQDWKHKTKQLQFLTWDLFTSNGNLIIFYDKAGMKKAGWKHQMSNVISPSVTLDYSDCHFKICLQATDNYLILWIDA